MVTDEQVRLLRQKRMEGKTQETAAAMAGMGVRTARKWESGPVPSEAKSPRTWCTREDPFAEVWDKDVVPLLEADKDSALQATTIMDELDELYPGKFKPGQVRTLQRRIRDWRALYGPDREVFFEQEHPPGREAAIDFTCCNSLDVTIAGVAFAHLLFVFKLSFSGWTWVRLAFSETFEALVGGLQGALWALGGVPGVIRSDNLSAATHELKRTGGRALNRRYKDVLDHYDTTSTRITPGLSHENGVVEKANDLVKRDLEQALILRGSRDFKDADEYIDFVRGVIGRSRNRHVQDKLAVEREHLKALPSAPVPSYTEHTAKVRLWSTIRVAGRTYSVPSRLIGYRLTTHQHADHIEVFYGDRLIERMPRLRQEDAVHIDYRHIIWSLVRKPGAFARYRYREELFPTITFRRAYDALKRFRGERADVEYVRILHLAASVMQDPVERALRELLERGDTFDYVAVKDIASPTESAVPTVSIPEPDLVAYDRLLGGVQ